MKFDSLESYLEIIENDLHEIEGMINNILVALMSEVQRLLKELQDLTIAIQNLLAVVLEAANNLTSNDKIINYIDLMRTLCDLYTRLNETTFNCKLRLQELKELTTELFGKLSNLNVKVQKWIEDFENFRIEDYVPCYDNELNALWNRIMKVLDCYNRLYNMVGMSVTPKSLKSAIPKFDIDAARSKLNAVIFDPAAETFENFKYHWIAFENFMEMMENDENFTGYDIDDIVERYRSIVNNLNV